MRTINIPDIPESLNDPSEFLLNLKLRAEDSLSKTFTRQQISNLDNASTVSELKLAIKDMFGL